MKPVHWRYPAAGQTVAFYDDNGISIDGEVEGWFTDDTVKRFEAYLARDSCSNGHNVEALEAAIDSES